jgi:TRAP transporter TAXI family solute receptor
MKEKGRRKKMKKKLLLLAGSLCLIIFLFSSLSPSVGAQAKPKPQEPFQLEISTIPAGFASYNIGVALADLISKNSTWLKAIHIEGRSPAAHMRTLVTKPEKRKNYLFFNTTWDLWEAKKQIGPYTKFPFNYDEFRFVMLMGIAGNGLCTKDPNIKGVKDLAGKKVIFDSTPGSGRELVYYGVLKQAGVSIESLKPQFSAGQAAAEALRDGLIDVIYTGSTLQKLPNVHLNSPFMTELVSTVKTYFVPFEEKHVKAFIDKTGHPATLMMIPPKMLGPLQTESYGTLIKPLGFCAHMDMPDDVVAEILRVVFENAPKLKEATIAAEIITKDTLASLSMPESGYHPAAVKFFKSKGIKITGFGI